MINPKSRADVAGKLTDDDKCSMVSVSLSSLQVAAIIHNNYCIISLHHEDLLEDDFFVCFFSSNVNKNEEWSPSLRLAECRNLITHNQTSVDKMYDKRSQ